MSDEATKTTEIRNMNLDVQLEEAKGKLLAARLSNLKLERELATLEKK